MLCIIDLIQLSIFGYVRKSDVYLSSYGFKRIPLSINDS